MKNLLRTLILLVMMTLIWKPVGVAAETVEAGNKICPLSGDEVKGKDFVEYKGKKYGICCAMCKKDFLKNPEKYIANLEKGAAPAAHAH